MKKLIIIILLSLVCVNFVNANTQIFSKYDTQIFINNDNTIDINKKIYLKNINEIPIVPGQIDFKVLSPDSTSFKEVLEYKVVDENGNEIRSKLNKNNFGSTISAEIFTSIFPNQEFKFNLIYSIKYEPKGIFFKNLQIPISHQSKTPIQEGKVEIILPQNYYINYIDYKNDNTILENSKVLWHFNEQSPEFVSLEYSFIPLKFYKFKSSLIFWVIVNLVLIGILFYEVVKEVKKIKSKKN